MAALYRLKGFGWLASCAVVAISFYLVSSQVAAERKRLDQVNRRIAAAQRDIRALETEFDVRANLAQLERWNGDTLALTVPTAAQFVRDEAALAAMSPAAGQPFGGADVQTAAVIVPSTPAVAPPPVVPAAATAPAAGLVKVAAVRATAPAAAPGTTATLAPAVATRAVVARAESQPRAIKAVAMVDRSLLSDSTIGELLSGARAERGSLR